MTIADYFGKYWNNDEICYVHDTGGIQDKGNLLSVKDYLTGGPFLLIHGNIIFRGKILEQLVQIQESVKPLGSWSVASKKYESHHSIVRVENGYITDWQFPAPDIIPHNYYRELGACCYDEGIFSVIERPGYENEADTIGVCMKANPENPDIAAIIYNGEWIHFENAEDLDRTDWSLDY